jgi:uncharacterized membrane protein YqjE
MNGQLEIVRTLVELGADKEAKDKVRNLMILMMMMMMMMMSFSVVTIMMIVGHADKGDSR